MSDLDILSIEDGESYTRVSIDMSFYFLYCRVPGQKKDSR